MAALIACTSSQRYKVYLLVLVTLQVIQHIISNLCSSSAVCVIPECNMHHCFPLLSLGVCVYVELHRERNVAPN